MNPSAMEDLAGAQGKLVLFVASILQRADILPMSEFPQLLSAFAAKISETDIDQGRILAAWAREMGELERQ